jgi:hypothetical protein
MKVKFNPVLAIFVFYICLSAYLIFSYFSFHKYLSAIEVVNLTPVAYGLLTLGSIFLALSLFSLFRIPFFHYLFKMINLWIVILNGLILWLYFEHGYMLSDMFNTDTQQSIAKTFPVTQPEMFTPIIDLIQIALISFKEHVIYIYLAITIVLAVIQIVLYMPSSLRYVYHTHISPIKYTIKHILVSLLLLAPLLFAANYYFKLDSSLNPELEKLLAETPQSVNDAENAFFPMLTLWISESPDRNAFGKQWTSEHRKMLAYFAQLNKPMKPSEYPGYRKLLLYGMNKANQAAINQLFIKQLATNDNQLAKEIDVYIKRYQTSLDTVRSLYRYQYYQNPVNYTNQSYTQFYSDYPESQLSLHRLNLLAILIEHGSDKKSFANNIMNDYIFNIRMIRNSSDPHVKLLHIEKQTVIVQFLYNLLQNPEFQNSDVYNLINTLPALIKIVIDQKLIAQKNIQLLKNQLDLANQSLANKQSSASKIIDYTFKYNKTLNCIYDQAAREYNLDNKDISAHIKRQMIGTSKSSLGNVIGNIICKASLANTTSDIYIKATEANGSIMLLKARSKLYEDAVSDVNIAAYLTNHSREYYNPFTGGALKWDRDTKQIYFEFNTGKENIEVRY